MQERFLQLREKVLNWILGIDPTAVLNSPELPAGEVPGNTSLDIEIKKSLNRIKAEAISKDGYQVDYDKLATSPAYQEFRHLVNGLREFDYRSLLSTQEKQAFWINLYNALVVDAVIRENVQHSVTESWLGILGFFQKAAYQVGGERFSLSDIEHGVLRSNRGFPYFPGPQFSRNDPRLDAVIPDLDPRIHFGLNCASNACPPISVYTPEKIDHQLDLAARSFINADTIINHKNRELRISKIFQWYGNDFGGKEGILQTLETYWEDPEGKNQEQEILAKYRLRYRPYDWGLNRLA